MQPYLPRLSLSQVDLFHIESIGIRMGLYTNYLAHPACYATTCRHASLQTCLCTTTWMLRAKAAGEQWTCLMSSMPILGSASLGSDTFLASFRASFLACLASCRWPQLPISHKQLGALT